MFEKADISKLLKNIDKLYAHKKGSENVQYELLTEHSDRVLKYFSIINKYNNISQKVKNIIRSILESNNIDVTEDILIFVYNMFLNAIYLHDIGKSNPGFQCKAMENIYFNDKGCIKKHSIISSAIYIDIYIKKLKDMNQQKLLSFVLLFSYIISRHHSNLEDTDFKMFCNSIIDIFECEKETLKNYNTDEYCNPEFIELMANKYKNCSSPDMYILGKLLFSLIVACDYAATYEYMNGKEAEVVCNANKFDLINKYQNRDFINDIRQRKATSGINKLRTDIFIESEYNLHKNIDKSIFYLEAPTGSGKTNTSINLALKILGECDINKVFYIFPFNTLAEQTSQVMEFWKNRKDFVVINSSTPIMDNKVKDENIEYEKMYFNYQLANYPVVITSHIKLFSALFGISREDNIWLYKLCNSVIILDEIQCYKNSLWAVFINILYRYAKFLNIKIIIMSATLPKLTNLISNSVESCDLIDGEKYFQNNLFKNRVQLDFSMLEKKLTLYDIANKVKELFEEDNKKTILIEFIFKKTAREFFNIIKEKFANMNIKIAEISGDDNKFERKKIIKAIKNREINIVVTTQVIEAGVDIDMDIGFKDISILDSEEQFIGRINRSCKGVGYAYFFNYDNEKVIYKNDIRTDFGIKKEDMQNILINKNFEKYFNNILSRLAIDANGNNYNKNLDSFDEEARLLKWKEINKRMKLIDSDNYQIVLNYNYLCDGVTYKGADIWNEYKELIENKENLSYPELKIKLSLIVEKLSMFTFNLAGSYGKNERVELHNYTEKIGNMFYFENGEEYISFEGKFKREAFEKSMRGLFI